MDDTDALRAENDELRRQLRHALANNHQRNLELDALHYVWCDGGCRTGVHRWVEGAISEEMVVLAERNTARLRRWWDTARWRADHGTHGAHDKATL